MLYHSKNVIVNGLTMISTNKVVSGIKRCITHSWFDWPRDLGMADQQVAVGQVCLEFEMDTSPYKYM